MVFPSSVYPDPRGFLRFWRWAAILVFAGIGWNCGRSFGEDKSPTQTRAAEQGNPEKVDSAAAASPSRDKGAFRSKAKVAARGSSITPSSLPNEQGQIWREYDLRPYTEKVTEGSHPEQAVVDWVLRETGTETWFFEPFGILNASRDTLRVYHTPQVHDLVADIVDRLVASAGEKYVLGMQLVTVGSPNWRSRAIGWLQPVTVQSPGVEAWLVSRENAALLMADLRKRSDFREHNSTNVALFNGQSQTVSRSQHRIYPRSLRPREVNVPGFDVQNGQIDEGYSLQISSLMSADGRSIDAVIRAQIDQVEKFVPVNFEVAGPANTKQAVSLQVPQLVSWRLHERFRWPAKQLLLLSCGVIATPPTERNGGLLNLGIMGNSQRADGLLLVELKGPASQVLLVPPATAGVPSNTGGRY